MLALEGIKILDLTWQGPGPYATFILGDLGADVTRIGPTPTAGARQKAREGSGKSAYLYSATNRNTKSILLNLKSDEGHSIFYRLAEKADVVVEGYRPGTAKRLGVDYQTVTKINPKIVYCSISGYGQDGPYRDLPGHDLNYISMAGALDLIGEIGRKPVPPLNLLADIGGAGKDPVIGILSALIARGKTGKGQHVDISLTDSVISLLSGVISGYFQRGKAQKRGESVQHGRYPFYTIYETKDGKLITIGCLEQWLWENLCREIGREKFIPFHTARASLADPADNRKWEEIFSDLRQLFLTKTRDEWFEQLSQKDIPIAKVYSTDEVVVDPQVLHRQMVIELEHPTEGKIKQVGIAIKLSDTPGKVRSLPPLPGEHTDETLLALGYSKQKIDELRRDGVVS